MDADAILGALLDAHDAQIEVLKVQAAGIRQRLEALRTERATRPTVALALLPGCKNVPERFCGLRTEDAQNDKSGFGVNAWECRGCDHREETAAGEASMDEN